MANWWEESEPCRSYKERIDSDKYVVKFESVGNCQFIGVEEHSGKQCAMFAYFNSFNNYGPNMPRELCVNVSFIPLSDLNKLFDEMQKEREKNGE